MTSRLPPNFRFTKSVIRYPSCPLPDKDTPIRIAYEKVTEESDSFLRIYDAATEPEKGRWFYPYVHAELSDQEIADRYYLPSYVDPYMAIARVPAGTKIIAWAAEGSDIPFKYEIELPDDKIYSDMRILPAPHQKSFEKENYTYIQHYFPEQSVTLVRLYDKKTWQQRDNVVFSPNVLKGRTPEQIKVVCGLSFVPEFVCNVKTEPHCCVHAYNTREPGQGQMGQVMGTLTFSNERELVPGQIVEPKEEAP